MQPKALMLTRLIIFTILFSFAVMSHAQESGVWKFSRVVKEDLEHGSNAANDLFLRKSFVSQDNFKDNSASSLMLNYEMLQLKDKKQHVFRAKLSCSGFPAVLKPGQEYTTTMKIEQTEFVPLGAWARDNAMIAFTHSRARVAIDKAAGNPFFRLGDLKLPGAPQKTPRVAEEAFKFTAAAHSAGSDEYGISVLMTTSAINASRIFVYRWHSNEESNAFHCPHCSKAIDSELLPK